MTRNFNFNFIIYSRYLSSKLLKLYQRNKYYSNESAFIEWKWSYRVLYPFIEFDKYKSIQVIIHILKNESKSLTVILYSFEEKEISSSTET